MKLIALSCVPFLIFAAIQVGLDNIGKIPDASWLYITGAAAIAMIALLWPRR